MVLHCDTHDGEDLLESEFYGRTVKQGSNILVLLDPSVCGSIWTGALAAGRDESKVKRYRPRGHSSDQWKRNWLIGGDAAVAWVRLSGPRMSKLAWGEETSTNLDCRRKGSRMDARYSTGHNILNLGFRECDAPDQRQALKDWDGDGMKMGARPRTMARVDNGSALEPD